MQSELKPCPFCGSNDLVTEQMDGTILYPAHRVRCDHCGASSRYSDREDWWAAWNTRATDKSDDWKFAIGDRVTKTKGSCWTGLIVGTYSTSLTPRGYAIESETERGSVQIYPEAAIEKVQP